MGGWGWGEGFGGGGGEASRDWAGWSEGKEGGGSGVQRLGWLVGGLGARQPKRAGRVRPDSF